MRMLLGIAAFVLFFLSDLNDWKWGRSGFKLCFPAGALILTAITVWDLAAAHASAPLAVKCFVFVIAALFLGLLVYTLFFALPAKASYASPGTERQVNSRGIYALCRHPGVLWFWGLYACLCFVGMPVGQAVVFCALNLLLVIFEDRCVFPARLKNYSDYRAETPFLLPNARSIRACMGTQAANR